MVHPQNDAEQVRDVTYEISWAEKLKHLQDASVDHVFAEPPFGSNISIVRWLIALRNAGYEIDRKTGRFSKSEDVEKGSSLRTG